jgi:hypothetical protein
MIIRVVWLGARSNCLSGIEHNAIQDSARASPLESARKTEDIHAIQDTSKCHEVREQLSTEDPSFP